VKTLCHSNHAAPMMRPEVKAMNKFVLFVVGLFCIIPFLVRVAEAVQASHYIADDSIRQEFITSYVFKPAA